MHINEIGNAIGLKTVAAVQTKKEQAFADQLEKALTTAKPSDKTKDAKLRKACQDMESVFLNMMLSSMRASVPKSELYTNPYREGILQSMLDNELAGSMSKAGGIGIADMLYRQLSPTIVQPQKQAPK